MIKWEVLMQAKIDAPDAYSGRVMTFKRIDLDLRDATVRQALIAIAKADGQVLWTFCTDDPEKGTAGFFLYSWRRTGGFRSEEDRK